MKGGIAKHEVSVIKNMIYPDNSKIDKGSHKKNLKTIKEKQEMNRVQKFEKDNYVPPEPYKMKEFKNVQSKLYANTKEWIANEKEITKGKLNLQRSKPMSQNLKKKPQRPSIPNSNNLRSNNHNNLKGTESMFEEYYRNKVREYSQSPPKKGGDQYQMLNNQLNENIAALDKHYASVDEDEEIERMNEKNQQLLREYEEMKRAQLKGPTPKSNEMGELVPKSQKNYIKENKQIIAENKISSKVKAKEEEKPAIHKDYGKTPDYLRKYKEDAEIRKEVIKQMKEEAKYPKGTRLLSEEERLSTLNGLIESKKEIETLLEKLPITLRTKASQIKKEELEKKLTEIENAISTFSRKQVFIKVDQ